MSQDTTAAPDAFKRRLVDLANANLARVAIGEAAAVRAIVDGARLVFGVYQDTAEPDGVGMILVKGHALLREIVASGTPMPTDIAAVCCTCAEQAEALRRVAGESDRLH